jgi:hypothetical protein
VAVAVAVAPLVVQVATQHIPTELFIQVAQELLAQVAVQEFLQMEMLAQAQLLALVVLAVVVVAVLVPQR